MPTRRPRNVKRVVLKKPVVRKRYVKRARPMYKKRSYVGNPEYAIFPKIKTTVFKYNAQSTTIPSGGLLNYQSNLWRCNTLYDPDGSNRLGNGSPMFMNTLLSATGPYQLYRVNAWKIKYTLINLSDKALYVYYDPCATTATEADSVAEITQRRGVIKRTLTGQANAKPMTTFSTYMRVKDFVPDLVSTSENYSATYNNDPSKVLVSTLLWQTIDGATATFNVALTIEYTAYVTLYGSDSS